ncbi:MAG: hypothetical protein ABI573_12720 [Chloroflexota bacterium]
MPAERIAENLAYVNWTVLAGLAIGSLGAVVLGRLRTDATRGYLGFTAFCSGLLAILAVLSDDALPRGGGAFVGDIGWADVRRTALVVLAVLTIAFVFSIGRDRRARVLGLGGLAAGFAALAAGAASWGGSAGGALALFVQLTLLAGATGGVLAAMILGHWYLVTPKLGEGPLILFSRILTWIVAAQLALFVGSLAVGLGPSGTAGFGALTGSWALFVWLRLIVGIVFPLVVCWAAIQTARSRSMESATGLLYISVGTIASGTILASGLYFGAGLLV